MLQLWKKRYYAWDCRLRTFKNKLEDEKTIKTAKQVWWTRNQVTKKAAAAQSASQDHNNSDPELHPVGRVFMTRDTNDKANDTWYLDSYASRHICNNNNLFSDIHTKNYKFITAGGEIIWCQEVGMVHFLLETGTTMTLLNVAYTPKRDSNLISLDQLQELGISYHNHLDSMILKQRKSILGVVSREKNLFILETIPIERAMLIWGRGQSTYHLSANAKIWLWHYCLGHISNTKIV